MPIHRVPRAILHEKLVEIERVLGERVMGITHDADNHDIYLVKTELRAEVETRVAL